MIKRAVGAATTFLNPQCDFKRTIFILGHMRCGSTALSNILCGHADVSGYGEAHIRYDHTSALGVLLINQIRRKAHRADARYLFDKILHSRYDRAAHPDFHGAYAIFMVRDPINSIRSIRKLFKSLDSREYPTDAAAADYYEERLEALVMNWHQFAPERRIGLTFDQLTTNPDTQISRLSNRLGLSPPLTNSYQKPSTIMGRGSGDPISAHRFDKIVPTAQSSTVADDSASLDLGESRILRLTELYQQISRTVTQL